MFGPAGRTQPTIAAILCRGLRAAIGTETVTAMPVDQGLGLAGDGGVGFGQHKGGSAHVAKFAQFRQRRIFAVGHRHRETGPILPKAQKDTGRIRGHSELRGVQKTRALAHQERLGLPHGQKPDIGPRPLGGDPVGVGSFRAGAVERVAGEGKHGVF